jgi:23S rRNA (cytidine1920-2'-O)/16S rRNA (cytidine1409-2'-O)-methyltransferase
MTRISKSPGSRACAVSPTSAPAPNAPQRIRLDRLIVDRGLVETRQKAQAMIMAGLVLVDGKLLDKAGVLVHQDASIELAETARYVGRGGLKLEAALDHFGWDVSGRVFLDIGSSTGGFVDCLLQRGAERVHAVDVGGGQLHWRLRQDARVRVHEGVNARYLHWGEIGEKVDGMTMDVSFISATMILPLLVQFAKAGTNLLVLVKPQFEVGKGQVGKGGIVRDAAKQAASVEKVRLCAAGLGFGGLDEFPCPLPGVQGNLEFFLNGTFAG